MAGYATDTSTKTLIISWTDQDGGRAREVRVAAYHDGVNDEEWTATIDGRPADLTLAVEVLIDGLIPLEDWPVCGVGGCTYWPIDDDDLDEHRTRNPHTHPKEEAPNATDSD